MVFVSFRKTSNTFLCHRSKQSDAMVSSRRSTGGSKFPSKFFCCWFSCCWCYSYIYYITHSALPSSTSCKPCNGSVKSGMCHRHHLDLFKQSPLLLDLIHRNETGRRKETHSATLISGGGEIHTVSALFTIGIISNYVVFWNKLSASTQQPHNSLLSPVTSLSVIWKRLSNNYDGVVLRPHRATFHRPTQATRIICNA